jgi:hypothetical protein
MKKAVQYFTPEYLKECAKMSPDQIIEFLEDYRLLVAHLIIEDQTSNKVDTFDASLKMPLAHLDQ